MTKAFRTPYGTMRLRAVQAVALYEAYELGGLFANIRVGGGKTILSGLLPVVFEAKRPLLLVPANLIPKTEREFEDLRRHWQIPKTIRIESYTKLGLLQYADLLWDYAPDAIIADEGQKLKHVRASACARRVARYLAERPECRFAVMSGTLTKGSILDYAHILDWALRDNAPIPRTREQQNEWSSCLDPKVERRGDFKKVLGPHLDIPANCGIKEARTAYRDRLIASPGVIVSTDAFADASLKIAPRVIDPPESLSEAFANLRTLWVAPDGWTLADARFEVWAVARQLALGFYYRHDPRPPDDWFEARKNWCKFVRYVLGQSEAFDSALQVYEACERGALNSARSFENWRDIRDTFKPNTVPVWLSDHAIEACIRWGLAESAGGIVWCEHTAFARRLQRYTDWPYYAGRGVDAESGDYIERAKAGQIVIASVAANSAGRNLQRLWHRNYIVSPPNSGLQWEQLLGRTHREGQRASLVTAEYGVGCYENLTCIENAIAEARFTEETNGQPQKLLAADLTLPDPPGNSVCPWAWEKTQTSM